MPDSRRLALALSILLVSLLTSVSAAAQSERYGDVNEVACTVRYNWPASLKGGYFPVEIELQNQGGEERVVSIQAEQSWGSEDSVRRRVALSARETVRLELLLRARSRNYSQYRVTFEVGGDEVEIGGAGPAEHTRTGLERIVLYASAEAAEAGADEAWSEAWSAAAGTSTRGPTLGHVHGHTQNLVLVCARTFDQLSPTWQAYTSLDTVIFDLSAGEPAPEVLDAALAWCRSGGRLLLGGVTGDGLGRLSGLEGAFEDRLRLEVAWEGFAGSDFSAYRHGFGVLCVQGEVGADGLVMDEVDLGSSAFVVGEAPFGSSWTRKNPMEQSRQSQALDAIERFANLPLRSLMLLIIGFAILMGPVNFIWVKRMRKPMLLLVTVPSIALVTSATLLLYGVFSQGLDIKTKSRTWTVLDQRLGWSTTAEVRRVFAGSAPGEGLRPEARTLLYPERRAWSGGHNSGRMFSLDHDGGLVYGGDYFPIRRPFGQLVLSDRAARLRLEVTEGPGGVEVTNALGATVEDLLLCDSKGVFHYLEEALAPGASVDLAEGGFAAKQAAWSEDLARAWSGEDRLVPGTYLARLDDAPLRDDCGVETNELEGRHVVLGLLDLNRGDRQ